MANYQDYFNQNYNAPNIFVGIIAENGDIFNNSTTTKDRKKVGIDNDKEQEYINQIAEIQSLLDIYFNTYGALPQPKSPEQIIQAQADEQAQINKLMLDAINDLKTELLNLKSNRNEGENYVVDNKSDDKHSEIEIGSDSKSNRKKSS